MNENTQIETDFPVRISVRKVDIRDEPPIYTTATGYGYEKHLYHSNEQMIKTEDKKLKVQEALVDVVRSLVYLRNKTDDLQVNLAIAKIINNIPDDLG